MGNGWEDFSLHETERWLVGGKIAQYAKPLLFGNFEDEAATLGNEDRDRPDLVDPGIGTRISGNGPVGHSDRNVATL